ncbi:MAG: NAD(P)/FAD-dependent oxidoreductase [Rhodospirillales bacterium]|nr:NAD(P)/FAD-dependent oxidoreductase [Rhodospirillales bacterium]
MNEMVKEIDVVIIGAGPVGLFAVHQCGMLGLRTAVIDSLPEIGGQCTALYPEKPIYDIPGYPTIAAGALIHQLEAQAAPFQPHYYLGQSANFVQKNERGWQIKTSSDRMLQTRSIIIAAGGGAFGPHRPPLENLTDYEGTSVFYMVRRREDFRDKKIVIAGGGDSAVDWALSLCALAESITLVHRREVFRAAPESLRQLEMMVEIGKISLCVPYQLAALDGAAGQLEAVHVADLEGHERRIPADVLMPFFGLSADLGPIKSWGLELDGPHIRVDPATCATNLPGLYAIGDAVTYPHKLKLILTGFAEAAQAAHAIRSYLNPDTAFHFEYSTTKGLPV